VDLFPHPRRVFTKLPPPSVETFDSLFCQPEDWREAQFQTGTPSLFFELLVSDKVPPPIDAGLFSFFEPFGTRFFFSEPVFEYYPPRDSFYREFPVRTPNCTFISLGAVPPGVYILFPPFSPAFFPLPR